MFYGEEKKNYLDIILEAPKVKKREKYFTEVQEEAVIKYNDPKTSQSERNFLFDTIIAKAFRKTIAGVLEMPMFHNITKQKINREQLIESCFFQLVFQIGRFNPNMIGKSGQKVKAYSFCSTVVKFFILEAIKKNNKILKNKADVETSIDLTILSEDNLINVASNILDEGFNDYERLFSTSRIEIESVIDSIIQYEDEKETKDKDLIKLCYYLKYILKNWDKIEFDKKNEFMRILALYTGFNQQKVSILFKKIKTEVLKKINPSALIKKNNSDNLIEDSVLDNLLEEELEQEAVIEDLDDLRYLSEEEKIKSYEINSFEDFENSEIKLENINIRNEWKEKLKKPNFQ